MIVSVTLNPSVDHTLFIDGLAVHDTNRVRVAERDAGGKAANLSRIVRELGGDTLATGFLGGGNGAYIRSVLDRDGVPHEFVEIDGETRLNFSVEDGSGLPPTTFNQKGPPVQDSDLVRLRSLLKSKVDAARWVALGGSLPPGTPPEYYAETTRWAKEHGVRVLVDADGPSMQLALKAGPDLIKPNGDEAARLLGREVNPDTAPKAIDELYEQLSAANPNAIVILSLGAFGAFLKSGETKLRGRSPQVEVNSTIGSGDSLLGGFLYGLSQEKSLEESLLIGLACGAATAHTDGSSIGQIDCIRELLPKASVERI